MPFQSEKQRRYLHANHPEIAKRWEKEYSNGGILDITGDEQITTDEGNDISLVDESETGVSTLFRAKDGGRIGFQGGGADQGGWGPGVGSPGTTSSGGNANTGGNNNQGSDHGHSRFDPGSGYYGGTTTTSTSRDDNKTTYTDPIITLAEKKRKEELKNLVETGPGSIHEKYDTWMSRFQDIPGTTKTNIHKNKVRINKARDDWNLVKDSMNEKYKQKVGKKIIGGLISGGVTFGIGDVIGMMVDGYKTNKAKQEFIGVINETIENYKDLGIPTHSPHTDTLIQSLEQELLDLTQKTKDDEDTGGDGPEVPVVAPVTEEIEDSYATVGNWMQGYRDLKAKQALSASLQEKWADERQWLEETMFANSGGLANLFRVKNQ